MVQLSPEHYPLFPPSSHNPHSNTTSVTMGSFMTSYLPLLLAFAVSISRRRNAYEKDIDVLQIAPIEPIQSCEHIIGGTSQKESPQEKRGLSNRRVTEFASSRRFESHQSLSPSTAITDSPATCLTPQFLRDLPDRMQILHKLPSATPKPSRKRGCVFSSQRTPTGYKLSCHCSDGARATSVASKIIDGVSTNCMNSCFRSSKTLEKTCVSGNMSAFKSAAKTARDKCCMNSCRGIPDGDTCVRYGPFSEIPSSPSSGCKVAFPAQTYGDQLVCLCTGSTKGVISPTTYAGIGMGCIARCARSKIENRICKPGRGKQTIIDGLFDAYGDCCESCGGKTIDGNLACVYRI